MPGNDADFRGLMHRAAEGSEEAASELVNRYSEAIAGAVRPALGKHLRPIFDTADFLQIAWQSLFLDCPHLDRFDSGDDLVKYLTNIAQKRIVTAARHCFRGKKRNGRHTLSLDHEPFADGNEPSVPTATPEEITMAGEFFQQLLSRLTTDGREMVVLRLEGRTHREIADVLRMSERSVRAFFKHLPEHGPNGHPHYQND